MCGHVYKNKINYISQKKFNHTFIQIGTVLMNYEKPQKLRVQKCNGKTVCNVLQTFVGPQVMSQSHVHTICEINFFTIIFFFVFFNTKS